MTETTLLITNPVGLHARPAALFVQLARTFKSKVTIQNLSRSGSAEVAVSAFNLLQIAVRGGHEIRLRAQGPDEREVIDALTGLVERDFDERPDTTHPVG